MKILKSVGSFFKKGASLASSLFKKGSDPRKTLKEGDFDVVDAIKNSYERDQSKQEQFGKDKGYNYIKELSNDNHQLYYNPEKKHLFMSVAGTHNLSDVGTDAMLVAGKLKDTKRYQEADMALKKAKQMYDVKSSSGVGHSLGGAIMSKLSIDKKVTVNKASEPGARTRQGETHIRTAGDVVSMFGADAKNTTTYHKRGFSLSDPLTWLPSHTYKNLDSDDQVDTEVQETIEKPKKKKIYNTKPKDPNAPKRERTQAQKEAWEKALKAREEKRLQRAQEKEMLNEVVEEQKKIAKKKVEDKVVKKAISIKKKQIKKEQVLDEISDDETPYEEVKKIATNKQRRRTNSVVHEEEPAPRPVNPKDFIVFW